MGPSELRSSVSAATRPRPRLDVVVVAPFTSDDEAVNDRFRQLSEMLAARGHGVELITSSFSHTLKRQRAAVPSVANYKMTYIREPGYSKNVSAVRALSHRVMARNLRRYLLGRRRPHLIYCAVPSLSVGDLVSNYCAQTGIPFVIDVQDLWPEAFEMVMPFTRVTSQLLKPIRAQAARVYTSADGIVAVSRTFAARVAAVAGGSSLTEVVYLGTQMADFDDYVKSAPVAEVVMDDSELRVAYVGTHGHSYDIPLVCDALAAASGKTGRKLRLVTMGDGPKLDEYRRYAGGVGIAATFLGRLSFPEMAANLARCHIAVNPIRRGSAGSVINKVADYAAAALPVVNTQDNTEYRELLERWRGGINAEPGDAHSCSAALVTLIQEPKLRHLLGQNNRRLAEAEFDRNSSYPRIVQLIERLTLPLND